MYRYLAVYTCINTASFVFTTLFEFQDIIELNRLHYIQIEHQESEFRIFSKK